MSNDTGILVPQMKNEGYRSSHDFWTAVMSLLWIVVTACDRSQIKLIITVLKWTVTNMLSISLSVDCINLICKERQVFAPVVVLEFVRGGGVGIALLYTKPVYECLVAKHTVLHVLVDSNRTWLTGYTIAHKLSRWVQSLVISLRGFQSNSVVILGGSGNSIILTSYQLANKHHVTQILLSTARPPWIKRREIGSVFHSVMIIFKRKIYHHCCVVGSIYTSFSMWGYFIPGICRVITRTMCHFLRFPLHQ